MNTGSQGTDDKLVNGNGAKLPRLWTIRAPEGHGVSAQVIDPDGNDVLRARGVSIQIRAGELNKATIEVEGYAVDLKVRDEAVMAKLVLNPEEEVKRFSEWYLKKYDSDIRSPLDSKEASAQRAAWLAAVDRFFTA